MRLFSHFLPSAGTICIFMRMPQTINALLMADRTRVDRLGVAASTAYSSRHAAVASKRA
jgi:hypothetical protein